MWFNFIVGLCAFALGVISDCLMHLVLSKTNSKVRVISRLYPTLSLARDIYNQVAFKLDKECKDFKLLHLEVKQNKKMQAFEVICKYEALGDSIFTF